MSERDDNPVAGLLQPPHCDGCGKELAEPGATLLGPPLSHPGGWATHKRHLCADDCYPAVERMLFARMLDRHAPGDK